MVNLTDLVARAKRGDPDALVELAIIKELPTQKIIDELTRGMNAKEVRLSAEQYADRLGITQGEYVRMAGPRG